MNEQIKELAEQATEYNEQTLTGWLNPEKFAELMVNEFANLVGVHMDPYNAWITPAAVLEHFGFEKIVDNE